jgi:hypothetical protein
MGSTRLVLAILSTIIAGCATASPYLGTWEGVERLTYLRVVLNADGSCAFVGGSIIGDKRDGIGGRCRYTEANDTISITEMGEIDGSGKSEKVPSPITLKYHAGSDSLSTASDDPIRLSRMRK